jgi:hypothetical protein
LNKVTTTNDAKLLPLEEIALRGLDAEERLLQIQVEEAANKLNERRALVYTGIEARLKLQPGSILSGNAMIQADSISWKETGKNRGMKDV